MSGGDCWHEVEGKELQRIAVSSLVMYWPACCLIILLSLLIGSQSSLAQDGGQALPPTAQGVQKAAQPLSVDRSVAMPQSPETAKAMGQGYIGVSSIERLMTWEEGARDRVQAVLSAIPKIPREYAIAFSKLKADATRNGSIPLSVFTIASILIAVMVERYVRRQWWRHWGGVRHVLPAIIFVALIVPVYLALALPPLMRLTVGCALAAFVTYRLASAAVEHSSQPRYYPRLRATLAILLIGWTAAAVGSVLGVEAAIVDAIVLLTSCIMLLLALELVWSNSPTKASKKTALSVSVVCVWLLWCLGLNVLFWLGVYLLILPHMLKTVSSRLHARTEASTTRGILLIRGSRSLILMAALIWVLHVWYADAASFGHDDPQIRAAVFGLVKAALIVLLAELFWHLGKAAIDRALAASPTSSTPEMPPLDLEAHSTRLNTLLPVVRNLLAVGLLLVAGLTVLGQLGFDTAPLLAGAGIFGVAIGFGSQTLVRDVISGIFYLFDDAFRVGEYIQAKDYKGTVEGFSLRSVKLRHHRGPLFTVPFGDLGAVENMSRDWSKMKLVVTLPYNTELEKVRKIGKSIGQSLLNDPEFGRYFVEPLKMKGVEEIGQYGIIVSFAMVTLPTSQQSFIRRSAFAMLRQAFQENGISFAQPTVQFGSKDPTDASSSATST